MKADVLRFLKTAQFGQLKWGMSAKRVESLLGPPWDVGTGLSNVIWMYGALEVFLYHDLLEGVYLYYRRTVRRVFRLPECIEMTGPQLSGRTSLPQFRTMLQQEHLIFSEKSFRPVDDSIRLTIGRPPKAVEAWFTGPANRLYLIAYFRETAE